MTISVFLALLVVFRDRWYLVIWGAFWSALPDYLTLYKKEKPFKTLLKPYYNFHDKVQFEVNKGPGIAFQGFTVVILVLILLGLAN
ncbi:hypothetical protein C4546_02760 [Candidatus Parcubacteria bacterium]|nr:MAG: hypothetical protein C4546_02760 [Candidatus Parcubacteria bacterium]